LFALFALFALFDEIEPPSKLSPSAGSRWVLAPTCIWASRTKKRSWSPWWACRRWGWPHWTCCRWA